MDKITRHLGDTVKALPDVDGRRRIGGHSTRFTNASRPDLHRQYFDASTDYGIEIGWTLVGRPYLIEHALDGAFKALPAGVFDLETVDDLGIYTEAWLHNKEDYRQMLLKMRQSKRIDWSDEVIDRKAAIAEAAVIAFHDLKPQFSCGALPQSVEADEFTGHLKTWYRIEGSGTLTPAEPNGTEIAVIKSAFAELKALLSSSSPTSRMQTDTPTTREDGSADGHQPPRKGDTVKAETEPPAPVNDGNSDKPVKQGVSNVDPEMIAAIAQAVTQQVLAGVAQMLKQEDQAEQPMPPEADVVASLTSNQPPVDPAMKPEDLAKAFAEKAYKFVTAALESRKSAATTAANVTKDFLKRTLSPVDNLPAGGAGSGFGHTSGGRVEVNSMKYAHLSPLDLAMAVKMAIAFAPRSLVPLAQRNVSEIMSEDLYKHAVHAMESYHTKHELKRPQEQMALKSARPWKAGELDASATTGAGLEYVAYGYDAQVWELARNKPIYEMMRSRGMMEKPVPAGEKGVYVPLEGADPTVYGGSEAVDLDSAGNPETVYQITPYGTANQLVQPGIFRVATGITDILEEDSLVDNVAEANRKIRLALEEHMEKAMLMGDTTTTASTNINTIDGSPTPSGLTKSYYLEFNGLMKSPLVTSTAYSRDAGGLLSLNDFLETLYKMPSEQNTQNDNLFFVIDSFVRKGSLKFPELKTRDTAEGEATVFTGVVPALWGIPVFTSGHLTKANTSGKVATVTPGNNTTGRILCVYAPYWAFTYKRQINIESMRFPQSETTGFYGSMRFSLTRRSASASSISYNVAV